MLKPYSRTIKPLLGLLALPFLFSCDAQTEPESVAEALRPVRTLQVTASAGKASREFPAVVDAARSAELSFRISGTIKEMPVKEGDKVEEGELIARLDQSDVRIQLKSAKANYETAKANYERGKKLVEPGHLSQSDFDKLKSKFTNAEADLAAARQNLGYTSLKASFGGRIAKRHVENFEEVGPQNPIVTLQDIGSLTIKIRVPEGLMLRTRGDGQKHLYFVTFEAIPEQRFPLELKEAAITADEEDQTYEVSFMTPRVEGYTILPGMSAVVVIETTGKAPGEAGSIFVPPSTVMEDRSSRFVYVVEAANSGGPAGAAAEDVGVIRRREVSTGELDNRGLQILSGLKPGEHLLTAGMSQAQPDMRVRWKAAAK